MVRKKVEIQIPSKVHVKTLVFCDGCGEELNINDKGFCGLTLYKNRDISYELGGCDDLCKTCAGILADKISAVLEKSFPGMERYGSVSERQAVYDSIKQTRKDTFLDED